jgi:hypothetical protein
MRPKGRCSRYPIGNRPNSSKNYAKRVLMISLAISIDEAPITISMSSAQIQEPIFSNLQRKWIYRIHNSMHMSFLERDFARKERGEFLGSDRSHSGSNTGFEPFEWPAEQPPHCPQYNKIALFMTRNRGQDSYILIPWNWRSEHTILHCGYHPLRRYQQLIHNRWIETFSYTMWSPKPDIRLQIYPFSSALS